MVAAEARRERRFDERRERSAVGVVSVKGVVVGFVSCEDPVDVLVWVGSISTLVFFSLPLMSIHAIAAQVTTAAVTVA